MNQILSTQFYKVLQTTCPLFTMSKFISSKTMNYWINPESPITLEHELELERRRKLRIEQSKILSDDDQKDKFISNWMTLTYKYEITSEFIEQKRQTIQFNKIRQAQIISEEGAEHLGYDLAVAHMVVALGGRVKLVGQDHWYQLNSNQRSYLPAGPVKEFTVEAIDLTGTHIMYDGMDYLCKLKSLSWLSLRACPFVTDHCVGRLQGLRKSLRYLDLGRCLHITSRGLSTLYSLKELKRLSLDGNNQIENKELVCLLLEEMNPTLYIEGVDFLAPLPPETRKKLLVAASSDNDSQDESTNFELKEDTDSDEYLSNKSVS